MKRIRLTADLFISANEVTPHLVDRALYWGEKHQDHHFELIDIVSIEDLPDEED